MDRIFIGPFIGAVNPSQIVSKESTHVINQGAILGECLGVDLDDEHWNWVACHSMLGKKTPYQMSNAFKRNLALVQGIDFKDNVIISPLMYKNTSIAFVAEPNDIESRLKSMGIIEEYIVNSICTSYESAYLKVKAQAGRVIDLTSLSNISDVMLSQVIGSELGVTSDEIIDEAPSDTYQQPDQQALEVRYDL